MATWASLPSVAIIQILQYLPVNDRLASSSVCCNWRMCLFNPSLWRSLRLSMTDDTFHKTKFLTNSCCRFVHDIIVDLDTRIGAEVKALCRIIALCQKNKNIKTLCIRPSSCHFEWPVTARIHSVDKFIEDLEAMISTSRSLRHLSLGLNEELSDHVMSLLPHIALHHSQSLQSLHCTSVKEDSENYGIVEFNPNLFAQFCHLQHLSLDYDYVCDDLLSAIVTSRSPIHSFCVNVHGISESPGAVTDDGWKQIASSCPLLRVTLNLIHSHGSIVNLETILKPHIPLVCYRQFFCSYMNVAAINFMSVWYKDTLETVHIIDGYTGEESLPNLYNHSTEELLEDPFVMLAWKCAKLRHFTLIGYLIMDHDLIAIARLRQQLATLTIPRRCIAVPTVHQNDTSIGEHWLQQVPESLGRDWQPVEDCDLHPAVIDANADAESSYINILLADQAQLCGQGYRTLAPR